MLLIDDHGKSMLFDQTLNGAKIFTYPPSVKIAPDEVEVSLSIHVVLGFPFKEPPSRMGTTLLMSAGVHWTMT